MNSAAVTYHLPPVRVGSSFRLPLMVAGFLACGVIALLSGGGLAWLMAAGALAFGANTVTYENPVAGTTAPTASESRGHQSLTCTVTGDGAATSFVITHNWGLTAAQLAKGFPFVIKDQILAAGYTAAAITGARTANDVTFANTAFTGAGLRITLLRPWSAIQ